MVLSVFCPWFHEEGALSGLSWTRSLTLRAGTILLHGYKLTPSPERFTLRHDSPLLGGVLVHSTKKVRILDRKSTRLNSSHTVISYAVFCLKKKKQHEYKR